jgi:zinc protease
VGAVDPVQALDKVTAVLGDWENPGQEALPVLPPIKPLTASVRKMVSLPGKSQTDILLGVVGPARQAPDYLAASLGNNILGQFGMYGRIGDAVREREGLAYYAFSSVSGGLGPGPWYVSAGVNPASVERAIELIVAELRRFIQEPVTGDELADSQANYIGRLPLSMESNAGVAGALLNLERYHLDLDYYRAYPDAIRAITAQQVLETALHYLDPDRLGIAAAGPG